MCCRPPSRCCAAWCGPPRETRPDVLVAGRLSRLQLPPDGGDRPHGGADRLLRDAAGLGVAAGPDEDAAAPRLAGAADLSRSRSRSTRPPASRCSSSAIRWWTRCRRRRPIRAAAATLQAGAAGSLGLDPERPTVALLPGSRHNEIARLVPVLAAALPLRRRAGARPAGRGRVRARPPRPRVRRARPGSPAAAHLVRGRVGDVLAAADVVVTASGTATAETALHERPMVVVYKVSPLTYRLGKPLVTIDTYAMANLVAGEHVVPELMQDALHARGRRRRDDWRSSPIASAGSGRGHGWPRRGPSSGHRDRPRASPTPCSAWPIADAVRAGRRNSPAAPRPPATAVDSQSCRARACSCASCCWRRRGAPARSRCCRPPSTSWSASRRPWSTAACSPSTGGGRPTGGRSSRWSPSTAVEHFKGTATDDDDLPRARWRSRRPPADRRRRAGLHARRRGGGVPARPGAGDAVAGRAVARRLPRGARSAIGHARRRADAGARRRVQPARVTRGGSGTHRAGPGGVRRRGARGEGAAMTAGLRGSVAVVLAAALVGAPVRAEAYLKFGVEVGGQVVPVRWTAGPIRYFVTERDIPGVSAQAFADAVGRAAATWDALPALPVQLQRARASRAASRSRSTAARPSASSTAPIRSGCSARPRSCSIRPPARCSSRTSTSTRASSGRRPPPARPAASTSSRWRLHELGHMLGLGHSAIGETEVSGNGRRVLSSGAVMFPIAMPAGAIADRVLQTDDIAGVLDLYGVTPAPTRAASRGGSTKSGQGVYGAHVVAFNLETRELIAGYTLAARRHVRDRRAVARAARPAGGAARRRRRRELLGAGTRRHQLHGGVRLDGRRRPGRWRHDRRRHRGPAAMRRPAWRRPWPPRLVATSAPASAQPAAGAALRPGHVVVGVGGAWLGADALGDVRADTRARRRSARPRRRPSRCSTPARDSAAPRRSRAR